MGDLARIRIVRIPPAPLHLNDDAPPQKTNRILKNDLLLHEAVIKNEPEAVKKVLEELVDVNSRNNYGRAPIHWAASRGNSLIIEMLMKANCDIEARDKFGMRPLHMAAWYGHLDAVKILIEAGANVSAVNKKKYTLLMCGARGNNKKVIEYLIKTVECLNGDAVDYTGASALHHASISGHSDVINVINSIPEVKLDVPDKNGQTPLHCACNEGNLEAVEEFIKLNSNLNGRDNDGNTPLHVATQMRHTDIVKTLLKAGADSEVVDELGLTALHVAASQGCKGILEAILQHNPPIINKQCYAGNTAIHLACENNEVEVVEILIKYGSDLNCFNLKLQSPMHIAAELGHLDVCKILIAAGANIEQRENTGKTPLYIAARGSFTTIVDMIIKTTRLEYPESINQLEDSTNTYSISTISDGAGCSKSISESVRLILWKISHKKLDSGDWKKLALHWAFTHDQIQAIEHQYTGPSSFKEHGYRMLMIWSSSLSPDTSIIDELSDALCAINKKQIADSVRKQLEQEAEGKKRSKRCNNCTLF